MGADLRRRLDENAQRGSRPERAFRTLLPSLAGLAFFFAGGAGEGLLGAAYGAGLEPILRLEREGDAFRRRAVPLYYRAFERWEEIEIAARRAKDAALASRSRIERARLAVTLLDPGLFARLRYEGPAEALLPAFPDQPAPDVSLLERLADLLHLARRQYSRLPAVEAQDVLLLLEAQALVDRLRGDLHQREADRLYREALAKLAELEPEADQDRPRLAAAKVRLRFKLRDLDGAWREASAAPELADLPGDEGVEYLRVAHALARFLRQSERALAYREKLVERTGKAEEKPRAYVRFHSFPVGGRPDAALTVRAFVEVLAYGRLEPRESLLAAYFGALGAIELGEFALAEELLERPLSGARENAWLEASVLARRAAARDQLGEYEGALHDAASALARLEEAGAPPGAIGRLKLLEAQILLNLGKLEEAQSRASALLKDEGVAPELALRARLLIAGALYERGRHDRRLTADAERAVEGVLRAVTALDQDVSARAEIEATASVLAGNLRRRRAFAARGERQAELRAEAIRFQDRALRAASKAGLWRLAAAASANLGELYLESGDPAAAREFIAWALERAQELGQFETEWRCRWYLARLAVREGDETLADREYARALELVESYRSRVLDAELKAGFLTDKLDLYRDLAERELRRGRPEKAFEVVERARARALVDSLGWRFLTLASPQETELYRRYVALSARVARLRGGSEIRVLGTPARAGDLEHLRGELLALRERILGSSRSSPTLKALIDGAPLGAREIRGYLGQDTVLIEYFRGSRGLLAFTSSERGIEVERLAADPEELATLARAFVEGGAEDPGLGRKLYDLLLAPLQGRLKASRLIVIPWGPLHEVPFEALRGTDGLVLDKWTVSYLPSASVLRFLASRGRRFEAEAARLLAFADPDTDYDGDGRREFPPLAGALKEVESFAPAFPARVVLTGKDAREAALRLEAPRSDVIHLACHGEFYPSRPWDSTLFLAPGGGGPNGDGRLRAYEVYGLALDRAELVALSGCETGRNEPARGDDPQGLATAFLLAGARSLLVGLWKVEDRATAELMRRFYAHWLGGRTDKAAALTLAKRELARGPYGKPRQWAGIVLAGIH